MTYDHSANRIILGEGYDVVLNMHAHFTYLSKEWSEKVNASESIVNDWKIIENWLNCSGRQLTSQDYDKMRKAWRAYYAIGHAPSDETQPVFDFFSDQYKKKEFDLEVDKPPIAVIGLFDRIVSADARMQEKQKIDFDRRKKFLSSLDNLPTTNESSWWRNKGKFFRLWTFGSLVWIAVVFLFVLVFDPFNNGKWKYMDDEEYFQMYFIMAIPLIAGSIKYMYDKYVK